VKDEPPRPPRSSFILPAALLLAIAFLVPLVRLISLSLGAPSGRLAPYAELIGVETHPTVTLRHS
jgi:hypothetical protein